MTERLTTLTAVKDWLGITTSDSDAGLLRAIDAASRFTLNYLNRPTLMRASYTQQIRNYGKTSVMLANWPVLEVTSVDIGGSSIQPSLVSAGIRNSGYYLSDNLPGFRTLYVEGYAFSSWSQVEYVAGFETNETDVIPGDPYQVTVSTGGDWSINRSVYIDSILAVEVDSAPALGQYSVVEGVYTFNAGDAGKTALITYGYVPDDIAFAVTEMVGEWYKRKDRIGVLSKTLGGQETVTYNNRDLTQIGVASLQPYRNVVSI